MSGLTPKQLQAVSEIAKGRTPSVISKDIRVSERTIQRWLKLSEFKAALAEIQERSTTKVIVQVSDDISLGYNRSFQKQLVPLNLTLKIQKHGRRIGFEPAI
jgi:hypothetical protein